MRWIRLTWLGWLLGVPLIAGLALLGEAIGIGGSQLLVGAGMGAGVGLLQSRVIRGVLQRKRPWIVSSAVGLALPFVPGDVATALGREFPYSLYVCVAVGGLFAGVWQAWLLRAQVRRAWCWVVASGIGWTLAGATSAIADPLSKGLGPIGALVYLGGVAVGGLVLGLVTGPALGWMLRSRP